MGVSATFGFTKAAGASSERPDQDGTRMNKVASCGQFVEHVTTMASLDFGVVTCGQNCQKNPRKEKSWNNLKQVQISEWATIWVSTRKGLRVQTFANYDT